MHIKYSFRRVAVIVAAAALSLGALSACSSGDSGGAGGSSDDGDFTVGVLVAGHDAPWEEQQADVATALAEKRGWTTIVLTYDNDPSTFTRNVSTLISKKVDAVVGFMVATGANAAAQQRFEAAGIPVITYDIAQDGWYFVGVDNAASGKLNGEAFGNALKEKWDCDVDLVLEGHQSAAGAVDEQRTGGEAEGLLSVCPDIPESAFQSFDSDGTAAAAQPAARNLLTANPNAKHIAVVGINDINVQAALDAQNQLGGDAEILGWGQDGGLIGTDAASPNMLGSAFYFLEGYPHYSFQILDKIAAGNPPEMADTAANGLLIPPCVVTAAEAADVPSGDERTKEIGEKDEAGHDLFCPTK
ncbi:sugar ABC transporter substrate-binding protein [Naasia lichenicola]|nr:substrate-binding domain-containing protein [Naasia lichenicola]